MKIGFIGQGWIGKNYADDFERRGFNVIRYGKESPYDKNKDIISSCDIVFIAVPTPTTPKGFDASIVGEVLKLIGIGKIAVIKSTILPGTTESLQKEHPKITILYSPEFLSEATAAYDSSHPFSNIVGLSKDDSAHRAAAEKVLEILPKSPFTQICSSTEAEIIKYSHNASGYVQIVFFNTMYNIAQNMHADWDNIQKALEKDPFISSRYARPLHKSGRGAGGHCFIKDFAALVDLYAKKTDDPLGEKMLRSIEKKNEELLRSTNKDTNILEDVYGK